MHFSSNAGDMNSPKDGAPSCRRATTPMSGPLDASGGHSVATITAPRARRHEDDPRRAGTAWAGLRGAGGDEDDVEDLLDAFGEVGAVAEHPGDVLGAEEGRDEHAGDDVGVGAGGQLAGVPGFLKPAGYEVAVAGVRHRQGRLDEGALDLQARAG